jgi:hypothetical protein
MRVDLMEALADLNPVGSASQTPLQLLARCLFLT